MSSPSDEPSKAPTEACRPLLRPGHPLPANRRLSGKAHCDRRHRRRGPQHADQLLVNGSKSGLRRRRNRWTRSPLMQPTIELAEVEQHAQQADVRAALPPTSPTGWKRNHPALKGLLPSSPIGIFFTALARAGVRGVDRPGPQSAVRHRAASRLLPEARRQTLIGRARGAEWTSGNPEWTQARRRHLRKFPHIPRKLPREYASMADEFHFRTVDARRSVEHIQDELRGRSPRSSSHTKSLLNLSARLDNRERFQE